jgi:trimeric autotransporter adhesin
LTYCYAMNKTTIFFAGLLCACAFAGGAQTTLFTYQGRLATGGDAANGVYDFEFRLYASETNGTPVGSTISTNAVPVTNGLFAVLLDFGMTPFNGQSRWLEISVKNSLTDDLPVVLSPRQPITPTPYALHAFNAANLMSFVDAPLDIKVNGQRALRIEPTTGGAPNIIGGYPGNAAAAGVTGAFIGGGGMNDGSEGNYPNRVAGDFGAVVGGWGNHVGDEAGFIGGGENNRIALGAFTSAIVGGHLNRIEAGAQESFIGGGRYNGIEGGSYFSVVSGGYQNTVLGDSPNATISGGYWNFLGGGSPAATISGGSSNSIGSDSSFSTIAGGERNSIGPEAWNSTIGGGEINRIETQADTATIAGGGYNVIGAFADSAAIGGGLLNTNAAESGTIAGGERNLLEEFAPHSVIGGGLLNSVFGATATIGGGGMNRIRESGATIAGGFQNLVGEEATYAAIGGGFRNSIIDAERSTIAGGHENVVQNSHYAAVGGGGANAIYAGATASVIGGGYENIVEPGALYSTISGGSGNEIHQNADGGFIGGGAQSTVAAGATFATIGGGWVNRVEPGVRAGTVAGGEQNRVHTNGTFATVGGGGYNVASGFGAVVAGGGGLHFEDANEVRGNTASGRWSAVLGGADNVAAELFSVIGGGEGNRADGNYAVVPGGLDNRAAGLLSCAAGWGAQALHDGSWVWADNSPTLGGPPLASTTNNQFTARAAGGVRFFTDKEATTGAELAPGSGSWSSLSDRNAKENFARANSRDVLDKLVALPLATWSYKAQDPSIRHIGPVAQDFHAAFGMGEDERRISSVDADGVALAAIQGLNQKVEQENRALRAELDAKEVEIQELKKGLAGLRELIALRASAQR